MPAELMLCGFFVLEILNGIANSIKNGCQNKKIREKVEMPMERMVEYWGVMEESNLKIMYS